MNTLMNKKLNSVEKIAIDRLKSYGEEIFHLYSGNRLDEMVASIKASGVIVPIIVRKVGDELTILAGHNRVNASVIAGLSEVPAIVMEDLSDNEARLIVTETNLLQRGFSELSVVEQASCIAVRYEAMKHKGIRKDLLDEVELLSKGEDSNVSVGREFDLSPRTISRNIRIYKLIDEMKQMIDDGSVGFVSGVQMSYLTDKHQAMVCEVLREESVRLKNSQAVDIRALEEKDYLTKEAVVKVLSMETSVSKAGLRVSSNIIDKYFVNCNKNEALDIIEKALEAWYKREEQ